MYSSEVEFLIHEVLLAYLLHPPFIHYSGKIFSPFPRQKPSFFPTFPAFFMLDESISSSLVYLSAKIFYISKIISSISPLCFTSTSWTKCFPEFSPPRFFISCLTSNLQTLIRCQSIRLPTDEKAMTYKACG